MIYTVGTERNYLRAIEASEEGKIVKLGRRDDLNGAPYPGGCVFKTLEEAQQVADAHPGYAVFGLDTDWETGTYQAPGMAHRSLLNDADIIVLSDSRGET